MGAAFLLAMQIITLDFETYFDKEYSLRRMTTEAYVRDPRFEVHGAAIRFANGETGWYRGDLLQKVLNDVIRDDVAVLAHHAQFEGLILSHHFGIRPRVWLDTLSMARLLVGNHLRVGLESLARQFNLGAKIVPYNQFKGRHWIDIPSDLQDQIAAGSIHDCELTFQLFQKLKANFPISEYQLVDITIRMFTEPCLEGDIDLLADIWIEEADRKQDMLMELGVSADDLQSSARFMQLLQAEGVDIEYKNGKNGNIPAFGKNDEFMKELLDDDDERVSNLVACRLGIKSTAIQTRAERLGFMAGRGALCIYLRYAGAATTRWAGGDHCNFQNLKRGHRLRTAIRAPAGYVLAAPDASQIECRFLNYLAGQQDVIDRFKSGGDPYVGIASEFYGRPITKADQNERGTGKQAELSCGYGCGWEKFKRTAALGIYGPPIELTDHEAAAFVKLYRGTHPRVVAYWREAESILTKLVAATFNQQWGPFTIKGKRIILPNGAPLIYDTLEWHQGEYRLRNRYGWQKMYGAKLVENVIQAIARVHIGDCMKAIRNEGLRIVGMSHDELWVLIEEGDGAEDDLQFLIDVISSSPPWLPNVPLAAEGKMGKVYAK